MKKKTFKKPQIEQKKNVERKIKRKEILNLWNKETNKQNTF